MNVEALREDAAWTQGKQPRMAVRPSWVLALCDLSKATDLYIDKPSEGSLAAVVRALKQVREV